LNTLRIAAISFRHTLTYAPFFLLTCFSTSSSAFRSSASASIAS
jgi:hypothetical protein